MAIIFRNLEEIDQPLKNPVLTIGNFDGVHKGHIALFDKVKERASALGGQSVVMTFDPHPMKVMNPQGGPPLITPTEQKLRLIEEAGVNIIFCLTFTKEFAKIKAHEFVKELLVGKIGVKEVVVGYDYTFGHHREGNIELLKNLGEKHGFLVHVIGPVEVEGRLVSSTSIRNLVREGKLEEAEPLLGRHYEVCGTVVKGKNRGGRLLGFPTANLELVDELVPKEGVYAVEVVVNGNSYLGVTNIGHNPTFGNGALSVETHLLDFSGDLVGKTIRIKFVRRLRDEKRFERIEALAAQIAKDIEQARLILGISREEVTNSSNQISTNHPLSLTT
ncbi:MAG TPA: bifunctional riboflavin kinase/FAD synthetase [Desulfobacterales bacterium]|nr:bifunctional riboflavin kinase/FAD synthetase [Desulfobacterales bacterium]